MSARPLVVLALLACPVAAADPAAPPPADVRTAFLKLLDRPRVPLDPKAGETGPDGDGLTFERVSIVTEKKAGGEVERVPLLIVRPAEGGKKRPAVLVLHGTHSTKEDMRDWLRDLARLGFVAVSPDARYLGERAGGAKHQDAYNAAIVKAWRAKAGEAHEHPLFYDTCWDVWRVVDYLVGRPDVDADRIGAYGFSKGGIEAVLAGAVDERIKVTVSGVGVQSFRWGLENDRWQARANTVKAAHEAAAKDLGEPQVNARVCRELWAKVIPGVTAEFDGPSVIRLFAGRPLLILAGEKDPNCPLEGVKLAAAAAEAAYREAKTPERLKLIVAPGAAHTVTADQRAAALEWFTTWLKP